MRELLVTTFLTLDGVMQGPGGPKEDDSGGFAHGGWSVNYWDDLMGEVMNEATSKPFAMVLGRRTYDIMAAFWPTAPEEAGAKTFNDATKYVASRGHPTLDEWSNSVPIEGDAADGIAKLKQHDGPELQVHGSANLIQTLIRNNLVDQYRLGSSRSSSAPASACSRTARSICAEARRQQGLDDRRRDRHVRARRRTRHRIVRVDGPRLRRCPREAPLPTRDR
jgi:dihydrofolate reductase